MEPGFPILPRGKPFGQTGLPGEKNPICSMYGIFTIIYLHLVDFYGTCRVKIPVPWSIWVWQSALEVGVSHHLQNGETPFG